MLTECLPFSFSCAEEPLTSIQSEDNTSFNIISSLGDQIYSEVEVYVPKKIPKALVIIVPGTGGISDPYFEVEISKENYSSESRGGLTQRLLEAGYAAAFYNQRGYASLKKCVAGNDLDTRAATFAYICTDKNIRKTESFLTITSDTGKIINDLKNDSRLEKLPQIILSFSEGIFHISTLIENKKINPIGVVFVGGPFEPMRKVIEFQIKNDYYFNIIETAFRNCPEQSLDVESIENCARVYKFPELEIKLIETMGGNVISKSEISTRRNFFEKLNNAFIDKFKHISEGETLNGLFRQFVMPDNWSALYYREALSQNINPLLKMKKFEGKIISIIGMDDHLIPIPKSGSCGGNINCRVELIENVGHGLEDQTLLPTHKSLERIISSLDEIMKSQRN